MTNAKDLEDNQVFGAITTNDSVIVLREDGVKADRDKIVCAGKSATDQETVNISVDKVLGEPPWEAPSYGIKVLSTNEVAHENQAN